MGLIFGLIKRLLRLFIYFIIFAAIIVLLPNLPPYTSFTKIDLEPTLPLVGPLALNNDLNNIEKLYTNKLLGPECFQLHKGEVYTSLATGEIVKLSPGGHVTFVTQLGQPCAGLKEEHKCGRPLGFIIDDKNVMYVADAYYGIWSVNLDTNKKTLLVSPQVEIKGQVPKLFNTVTLDSKGTLYYTDSSADFALQDGAFSLLADPNGRLLQYNAAKNESKVLLDKLWFPNGVVVSPDDEFIVIAETGKLRLIKYYLNGPKKGQTEVFLAGLPGTPDNVRALPGGGLQVALYAAHADAPPLAHTLAAAPLARKFVLRLMHLVQNAFQFLHKQYPHVFFEDVIYGIGHFKSFGTILPESSGLIHVDWNGNIIKSYYHNQGQIHVSDAILFNDKVYIGQPHGQNFVASVPAPASFKKAFTSNEQQKAQVKREAPNTQATPKPPKVEAPKTTPPPPKPKQQPPSPKPTQQPPKPTQPPTTTTPPPPKPAQQPPKTTPPPPTTTPKPATTTSKPATTTPPPPKTTQKPSTTTQQPKATQKPVEKKPAPPSAKPTQDKPKPQIKVETPSAAKPTQQKKADTPKQIPITEEIPSDTIKPNKETLKVIKKGGPAEIPNPEL